jgi:tetratricopeptide (TPR) repeat protein
MVAREAGFIQLLAEAHRLLGLVSWAEGDLDDARSSYEQASDLHRAGRDPWQETVVLGGLGYLCAVSGDVNAALDHYGRGLRIVADLGSADRLGALLRGLVPVLWRLGRRREAVTLLGACEVRSPVPHTDAYTDALRVVEEGIVGPDLEAAQVAGRQLTHREAIAVAARAVDDERPRHRA